MTNTWKDLGNSINRHGCIGMGEAVRTKVCLICGVTYTPVQHQYDRQKYCSKTCKERMAWMKCKERGVHKGGYSRHVPLVLWLKAKDNSAPTFPAVTTLHSHTDPAMKSRGMRC